MIIKDRINYKYKDEINHYITTYLAQTFWLYLASQVCMNELKWVHVYITCGVENTMLTWCVIVLVKLLVLLFIT